MKKFALLTLVILTFTCYSQTKNFIDQNYIEVTGKAEMEIVPDEIYLQIVLNENDLKGNEKLEDLEASVISKLEQLGIDISKDLALKDIASNFKDYWLKPSEAKTEKVYQLKVSNARTAGMVFREMESLKISKITIESVDHSKLTDYRQQVKIEAIKAAKTKAESLAGAIDQTCGKAIYIQEINHRVFTPVQGYNAANSNILIRQELDNSGLDAPGIEFETIKLEYSILVRFALN